PPGRPPHALRNGRKAPGAGPGPAPPPRHFLAGGLTRSSLQSLKQFLLHGFALLEATSDGPPHVGGPATPPPLASHTPVTSRRPYPGPGASVTPAWPRREVSCPWRSLTMRHTAPGRRGGNHDRDSIPALVARAFLGSMFVGLPSPCSCWLRWLYITGFGRQSSSGGRKSADCL